MRNRNIISGVLLILILVIMAGWAIFGFYTSIFPNKFGCRILGIGGISHVPANCIEYFVNQK